MFPLRHSNSTHLILPHQPSQAQCIRLLRDDDRLAVLRQSQILDNHNFVIENLQDYDRLVILTQRYFRCDLASLSFFDQDKQWLLSCAGPVVSRPLPEHRMLELTHSLDCYFLSMYSIGENRGTGQIQDSVLTGKYRALEKWLNLNDSARFYAAALIFVDHKPIGVLSIMHFTTRDVLLPEDVLTLKEYADAIASMLKERRDNVLRCQQERANLMLGLNHHLRTPVSTFCCPFE